jgi:hypothetical protein
LSSPDVDECTWIGQAMRKLEESTRAGLASEGIETHKGEESISQVAPSGTAHFTLQTFWAMHN